MYQLQSIIMPYTSYLMHNDGLEIYNNLIKILILLLCISIRQVKQIKITIIGL